MGVNAVYSIRSLKHAYDRNTVLDIPVLDICEGTLLLFSGPNGSGKSTLLSILALLQIPSSGSIRFSGVPCSTDPNLELRRRVTLVHQKPVLFSTSVRRNISYGLRARGIGPREIEKRVHAMADAMQISTLLDKYAAKLSGGEAQRVVLARALVLETPVLLLDEPTNSLDAAYRPALVNLLHKTRQDRKTTIIIATHDSNFISSLSGRVLSIEKGVIQNPE